MTSQKVSILRLTLLCVCAAAQAAGAAPKRPTPFVRLFDTRAASRTALAPAALNERTGWAPVADKQLAHAFAGDAVFMNDKLAVVVRRGGPGPEVYSLTGPGPKRRAELMPRPAGKDALAALASVKIVEHRMAAVMLEATYRTQAGGSVSLRLRLTTGSAILEVRPGRGAGAVFIRHRPRYVIVPEFFTDDMIFTAAGRSPRRPLPTENAFLSLLEGRDAVLMCVWRSNRRGAEMLLAGEGQARAIRGCEVQCPKGRRLWIALLTGKGIWHDRTVPKGTGDAVALEWRPPFRAKWRCSRLGPGGVTVTRSFADKGPAACWFDSGRAFVRPDVARPQRLVVYALDRNSRTPLSALLPIDVVRNALSVGPCQYMLGMEGLGGDGPTTPKEVTGWVERQFRRRKSRRDAEALGEQLTEMAAHVARVWKRIDEHRSFAVQLRRFCEGPASGTPAAAAGRHLGPIAAELAVEIDRARRGPAGREDVAALAEQLAALAAKEDPLPEFGPLARRIRRVGDLQTVLLARARIALRRLELKASGLAAAAKDPQAAALAREVARRARAMLQDRSKPGE